jgi:hypothetical protein
MSAPPGPYGHPGMPPRQSPGSAGLGALLRRHPLLSIAAVVLVVIAIIAAVTGNSPASKPASATTVNRPSAVAPLVASPLACGLRVSSKHPRDHTRVTVRVRTVARARVSLTTALVLAPGAASTGRASADGIWIRHLQVGDSPPAVRVTIAVRVTRGKARGTCETWVRPRSAAAAATPSAHPTTPATTGCYPLTDSGGCYEPGEFCRDSDHGVTGVAGDGQKIVCADNDGWRWEPYSGSAPPPAPAPTTKAPPPAPAGCYPKTDSGGCYEPGEFCRDDDHGVKGVAGDGEDIVCADNDGWRWEPY